MGIYTYSRTINNNILGAIARYYNFQNNMSSIVNGITAAIMATICDMGDYTVRRWLKYFNSIRKFMDL